MLASTVRKSGIYICISLALSGLLFGCGGKEGKVTSRPIKKAVPPPIITPAAANNSNQFPMGTAKPEPAKNFWVGHINSYVVESYNEAGQLIKHCDLQQAPFLKKLTTGGVTALSFFDAKTLLALLDPGAEGEQIVAINTTNEACEISPWYTPSKSFENITSNSIMPILYPGRDYARIFIARDNGVDRFTWNKAGLAMRANGVENAPFVPINPKGIATCTGGKVTTILTLGEGDNKLLLMLTTGEGAQRLNVIGSLLGGATGNPQCLSSLNYAAAGQPTSAEDTPIQAVTLSDKRIYILFQNVVQGAKLVRYDFNGTQLVTPFLLSQDPDDLGFLPTAMTSLTSKNIVIANGRSLAVLDTISGRLVRPLENSNFNAQISALASEP